ncbi:MAG: polysaccharide deacetylase family protein [Methylomonas sp.]|nr:polysaccharide deacetylase family protein [Methylomonas sp.]PPD22109.1 MAG: polysaccharide deacetylase [Methylomonas sp.]PPD42404.1 MAG: polysaccharide deacetylase [Methylomonas sp.]PPD53114.1 MAG: polysaccharide deacetylase [Methylomonas sp.]
MAIDIVSKRLFSNSGQNGLVSIMYHSITPEGKKPDWQWALSHREFNNQLSLLEDHGWTTLSIDDFYSLDSIPPKSVLITFDDGYADNLSAFEELTKRKMIASWFVVTKDIDGVSSWTDTHAPKLKMLSKAHLVDMQSAGMSIGSHTHSHCRLTRISEQSIETELRISKEILCEITGKEVISFAYPYGDYDTYTVDKVISAGYKLAFTTRSGFGVVNNSLLEIRRISITNTDTLSSFARKLAFAANDVSWKQMANYFYKRFKARINQ